MGKMKRMSQSLTEVLEDLYTQEKQKIQAQILSGTHPAQNMVVQGGGYSGQGLMNSATASQLSHAAQQASVMRGMYGQALAPHIRKGPPTVDNPNKREAYVIPLSTLANMWRAKYGDLWVDVSELDEEFWMDASARLHRNKLMEEIEFRESNTPWARLKEGVLAR
jgi:hypothetical protein